MKAHILLLVIGTIAISSFGTVPDLYDTFDTYANGTDFVSPRNGWQASSGSAIVTNAGAYDGHAVFMSDDVVLTNTMSPATGLKVWTDLRLKPMLGDEPFDLPTNTSSFICYFTSEGFANVATRSGWQVCSNDIWGNSVPPATNGYVRLSIVQDYVTSNQAVFLNDQLILQDAGFVGSSQDHSQMMIRNSESNCWVDRVWVKTNMGPDSMTSNRNGDNIADASELQVYGYACRTQYVGMGGTPSYATIQAAVNASRPRDTIYVPAGMYSENVTIMTNVTFAGQDFSLEGNAITVGEGVMVAFAQSIACGSLGVAGQMTMAAGASLTAAMAEVTGHLAIAGNGKFVVGSLSVTSSGIIQFSDAQFVASSAGVDMAGTFAISNTWGSAVAAPIPLPFSEDFESYAENTVVTNLGFSGWAASDGSVVVKSGVGTNGSKAVFLPDGTVLSNSINSASATKVWTDCYIQPVPGIEPSAIPTNSSSFFAYVNTSGFLVVAVKGGGWYVCSNKIDNTPATPLQNDSLARLTVCQDLVHGTFAVFVAGDLVAHGLEAPINFRAYSSFAVDNEEGTAILDNVMISTASPPGTSDMNQNGVADAYEINICDIAALPTGGSVFKFR